MSKQKHVRDLPGQQQGKFSYSPMRKRHTHRPAVHTPPREPDGTERVQKIISNAGFCSRRKAEEYIADGVVTVNGEQIKLGDRASAGDEIRIGNVLVQQETRKKVYMAFNKPIGYVTTLDDPFEKKTIAHFITVQERVYPIGRLDKNSHGLLILTNDGNFANKLMHPRYEVPKTYQVQLDRAYDTSLTEKIRQGIFLRDGIVKGDVRKMAKNVVEITLHEGRKHIVKRLFKKCGYTVFDLLRTAIGPLRLDIKAGKTRPLTNEEVQELSNYAKNMQLQQSTQNAQRARRA